jgi:2,3-bisphosphoglycerate-independent phosphoglycerate mutase
MISSQPRKGNDDVRPTVLMVLDGWGIAPAGPTNAISVADQVMARLGRDYPSTTAAAHGREVGLLDGQMGDSNVGHLTIGAGRVVDQTLTRIHRAVAEGTLAERPVLQTMLKEAEGRSLHLLGLLSPGGVHSHETHLGALLAMLAEQGRTDKVYIHAWLDGRDVSPQSAARSFSYLAGEMNRTGVGQVASVAGRYYAMDRDNRWDRIEQAYRAMVEGKGATAQSAVEALEANYAAGKHDEFVVPTVIVDDEGKPVATIGPDDVVFVFNFRADRVRQITRALADPDFDHFSRPFPKPHWLGGMAQYDEEFFLPRVFEPPSVEHNLAQWLSERGISQLHVAETEKYAHVTFFFNGGQEKQFPGEDRKMIASPKVATYDLAPAMAAEGVANAVIDALEHGTYGFIVLNFANADMVGHTGKLEATEQAIEALDQQIARVVDATLKAQGTLLITADHGNAEIMQEAGGGPHTNHTTSPVPVILISADPAWRHVTLKPGALKDIAPTVLTIMGIEPPAEMTGTSLIER